MTTDVIQAAVQENDLSESVWWASVETDSQDQTVFLYRKEAGQWSLLDKLSVDQDTMPTLEDFKFSVKELHGGGIYETVIRTPKGALARRIPFSLSGLPKRIMEQAAPVAPVQENATDKLIAAMMEMNRQATERQEKILVAMLEQNKKPEIDPFTMFDRAMALTSKSGVTPPAPKSLIEQATELVQLKELFGGDSGAVGIDGWGAIAAALGPLSEVLKEGTINERLKLKLAIAQAQKKPTAQPVTPPAAPTPAPQLAAPKFAAMIEQFKPVLAQIVPYAQQGASPGEVAAGLIGIAPDKAALYEFLNRDDALNDMARIEPKVAEHWEWFSELANAVLEQIEQAHANETGATAPTSPQVTAEPQAQTSGGSAGDTANPATDGKPSPKRTRKPVNQGASVTAS